MRLFSEQVDPAIFQEEETGANPEFTAARLFSKRPESYRAIVALSAEGLGAIRIGRLLHVSPNTVLAVRQREPEKLDIEKNRIAMLSREAARMCVEAIVELLSNPAEVKELSLKDLGIVHGILVEKSELLSGAPTARLQTVSAPEGVEVVEYLRWIRSEYQRRMGLREEKEGEKEARLVAAGTEPVPGADRDQVAAAGVGPGPTAAPDQEPGQKEPGKAGAVQDRAPSSEPGAEIGPEGDRATSGILEGRENAPPLSERAVNIAQNEGSKSGRDS